MTNVINIDKYPESLLVSFWAKLLHTFWGRPQVAKSCM